MTSRPEFSTGLVLSYLVAARQLFCMMIIIQNSSRCQVIHVIKSKNYNKHIFSMDNAKYLGLDLYSDLSYTNHISRVTTSANKTLCFIKRYVTTKTENVIQLAYKTLVRPASSSWILYTKITFTMIDGTEEGS